VPRAWQKGKQSWQFKLKLFAASQQQAVKPKNDQRKKTSAREYRSKK